MMMALANLFNFVLFAALLWWFAGPKVKGGLRARHEATMGAIRLAEQAKFQATMALSQTQSRLATIDSDLRGVVAHAADIVKLQVESVEANARQDAEKLRVHAKAEVERERLKATEEIRRLMLAQAFERASLEIQQQMTPERQRELVKGLIQKVGDGSLVRNKS